MKNSFVPLHENSPRVLDRKVSRRKKKAQKEVHKKFFRIFFLPRQNNFVSPAQLFHEVNA